MFAIFGGITTYKFPSAAAAVFSLGCISYDCGKQELWSFTLIEAGHVVKAVYNFSTDLDGELALKIGDVIQVIERIDKQWLRGICAGQEGTFPASFVLELKIPNIKSGEEIFTATSDFIAQEDGDLSFAKGDLIVGLKSIDSNWWHGEIDGKKGIFPLTHAWKMDATKLKLNEAPKKVCLRAQVKVDMNAQLEEEMDLKKGEILTITEIVDKDWYRGHCDGRSGIFPAGFVSILDDQSIECSNNSDASAQNMPPVSVPEVKVTKAELNGDFHDKQNNNLYCNIDQLGYDSLNSGITAYGRTLFPFTAQFSNELSFGVGSIVNLISHVDDQWTEGEIDGKVGIFPTKFIDIIVDCTDRKNSVSSSISSTSRSEEIDFLCDTYGRVLYDFKPQVEGDLNLKEGDTVTLIRQISNDWYEAVTDDGDIGVCPANFIEIIGSAPPSYAEVMQFSGRPSITSVSSQIMPESSSLGSRSARPASYPATSNDFQTDFLNIDSSSTQSLNQENSSNLNFNASTSIGQSGTFPRSKQSNVGDNDNISTQARVIRDLQNGEEFSHGRTKPSSSVINNQLPDNSFGQSVHPLDTAIEPISDFSSRNIRGGSLRQRHQKDSSLRLDVKPTPPRPPPPPPTIIWPSRSGVCQPNPQLLPHRSAPAVPSSNRNSTGSVISSQINGSSNDTLDGMQQLLLNKEIQVKRIEMCRNKAKIEIENNPDSNDEVLIELRKQVHQCDEEIEELKKEMHILQGRLQKQVQRRKTDDNIHFRRHQEVDNSRNHEIPELQEEEESNLTEGRRNKMRELRQCVITELIQTERDYLLDLKLLFDTFLKNPEGGKIKGIDMETVFGNLDEVIDLSNRLLRRLQKVQSLKEEDQKIGECFIDLAEDMKQVYGHYCRNHDDINSVLDKYEEKSPAGQYLKRGIEAMKEKTNCFDLPSMLIKPVQRILKYPLLLNELHKCTEDKHPDKESLIRAINLITDCATAINEFKRRKDLVFKYRKNADTSLSGRISKLNFHSVRKKYARFGMRLSATFGLNNMVKDEEFENVVKKFHSLEKTIKIFLKDVNSFCEQMKECVMTALSLSERIADLYLERKNQQEVDNFRGIHIAISTQFFADFKNSVDRNVIGPLTQTLQTFVGPNNLIQKRYDKLLDYVSCTSRLEKNKDVTKTKSLRDTQQLAKNTYEALNFQLLDDMPKLCSITSEILKDSIMAYLRARKSFIGRTAKQMLELMELPLLLGAKGSILETFQTKHNLVVDSLVRLSLVPTHTFPASSNVAMKGESQGKKHPSPHSSSHPSIGTSLQAPEKQAPQNTGQQTYLKSRYLEKNLYYAKREYQAVDLLDISLRQGDLVGIIKQQDPMGGTNRWFVDNGVSKGFVAAKYLAPYITSSGPAQHTIPSNQSRQSIISSSENVPNLQPTEVRRKSQPSRPAPVLSQKTKDQAPCIPRPVNRTAPLKPIQGTNVSQSAAVSEAPSHRYEEIPDLMSHELYDLVAPDVTKTGSVGQRYSNVPVDEFDPYAPIICKDTYDNVPDHNQMEDNNLLHRYEEIAEPSVSGNDKVDQSSPPSTEYYYAAFAFASKGSNQLNLTQGQVVLVINKCDLNGNPDWWFVENRYGQRGYVPGNYLVKYQ